MQKRVPRGEAGRGYKKNPGRTGLWRGGMRQCLERRASKQGVDQASGNKNDQAKGEDAKRCKLTKEQLRRADVGWVITFLILAYVAFYGG